MPLEPLPLPSFKLTRWIAISVVAFGVFAGAAGILLSGRDAKDNPDVWLVVGVGTGASTLLGLSPYLYELAATGRARIVRYGRAAEMLSAREKMIGAAVTYLRQLNTDVPISEIRDKGGTVHLIFPYGTDSGLGQGMVIEIVRQTGGERLGTVTIVDAARDWSLGRPTDRTVPDFWDGLEDRMNSDFAPPAAVVGRIFRITGSTVADLLQRLEEENARESP